MTKTLHLLVIGLALIAVVLSTEAEGKRKKRWYRCKARGDPHFRTFNNLRYSPHGIPASYEGAGPLPTGKENQVFHSGTVNETSYDGGVYRFVNSSAFTVDCMTLRSRRSHMSYTSDCSLTFHFQSYEYVLTIFREVKEGLAGRFEIQQPAPSLPSGRARGGSTAPTVASAIVDSVDLTLDDFVGRRKLEAFDSNTTVFQLYGRKRSGKKQNKKSKLGTHFWAGREEDIGNRRYSNRFVRRGTTVITQVHYQTQRFFNNDEDLEQYQHVPTTGWCGYPIRDDRRCQEDLGFFLPFTHPQATHELASTMMTCNATAANAPTGYMLCRPTGEQKKCRRKRKRRDVFAHEIAFKVCDAANVESDSSCFFSAQGSHLRAFAEALRPGDESPSFVGLTAGAPVQFGDMSEERRTELCAAYFAEQESQEQPDVLSETDREQATLNCVTDLNACTEADVADSNSLCRQVAFSNIDAELDPEFGEGIDEEDGDDDNVLMNVAGIAIGTTTALVVSAAVAFTVGFALFIHVRRRQYNSFFRELNQQGITDHEQHHHFGVM